jgi:hypothetical protein
LLRSRDTDAHRPCAKNDGVALKLLVYLPLMQHWLIGGGENEFPLCSTGQIGEKVQRRGMDPGLNVHNIGELNGNPFSRVDAGQLHAIQISRDLKLNQITKQRSGPPVEGMVERIVQHKANPAEFVPDLRLGGK